MQHAQSMFSKYRPVTPQVIGRDDPLDPNDYDCPPEVKQTFSSLTNSITYSFNGNEIRFFYTDEDCDLLIQHVARLLSVIQVKPVIADILLSSSKKFYPKGCVFGESHLNTGYCTGDKIVVYRKEEWFKVFIHECFHYFQFDQELYDKENASIIQTVFNLEKPIHLNESYCEVAARVLQCCFISSITNFPVQYLYEMERQHSIQNMVNVLHHMKMEYESLFQKHSFKEETNVFSYIVLGGLLMYLKYIPVYHKDTNFKLLHPEAYIRKIIKHCKDDSFIQEISLLNPGVTTTMSILQLNKFKI